MTSGGLRTAGEVQTTCLYHQWFQHFPMSVVCSCQGTTSLGVTVCVHVCVCVCVRACVRVCVGGDANECIGSKPSFRVRSKRALHIPFTNFALLD